MNCPSCGRDHGDTTACPTYGGSHPAGEGWSAGPLTQEQEERVRQIVREEFRRAGGADPFTVTYWP